MRVHVVDPAAYTPPYDHALCAALARAGADVELITTRFAHGDAPAPGGYTRTESFYRWSPRRGRRATRLLQHPLDMYSLRRRRPDVTHLQWLPVPQLDVRLLPPQPRVLTAHDVLPREPRPGQLKGQARLYRRMDAVVAHSRHGRDRLTNELGLDPDRVHVIPHGAFTHLTPAALPAELTEPGGPVAVLPGLMRPYKGIDLLLDAWRRAAPDAELWIVGNPRFDIDPLRRDAPATVRWVPRFVTDPELAAVLTRADLVVLPYREIEQSGVLFAALGLARPLLLTDVGGFGEVAAEGAAELVPRDDPDALAAALTRLLADPDRRAGLAANARRLADGPWSWDAVAAQTLDLYTKLI